MSSDHHLLNHNPYAIGRGLNWVAAAAIGFCALFWLVAAAFMSGAF